MYLVMSENQVMFLYSTNVVIVDGDPCDGHADGDPGIQSTFLYSTLHVNGDPCNIPLFKFHVFSHVGKLNISLPTINIDNGDPWDGHVVTTNLYFARLCDPIVLLYRHLVCSTGLFDFPWHLLCISLCQEFPQPTVGSIGVIFIS